MINNMSKKKIVLVVGARPNFMKSAPLLNELEKNNDFFENILIHTGQHYDSNLSDFFFEDLKMQKSDIYLGIGSGTHAEQTGNIMIALEKELIKIQPDLVIVFGDINSTLATAIVTSKLDLKLAHIEAGLRSFDNRMPEEINRIVTDRLADYLFVTEKVGVDNLINEGVAKDKIHLCGNIMIDALMNNIKLAQKSNILTKLSLNSKEFVTVTLHRPSNVDNKEIFEKLIGILLDISKKYKIIFPCHPRTYKKLKEFSILDKVSSDNFRIIEPLGYHDFLKLMESSKFIISDSGGIQADATYLKIPCLTLRETTEQPSTIEQGTNTLCGNSKELIKEKVDEIISGKYKSGEMPDLWDGKTSERIVKILREKLYFT